MFFLAVVWGCSVTGVRFWIQLSVLLFGSKKPCPSECAVGYYVFLLHTVLIDISYGCIGSSETVAVVRFQFQQPQISKD